MSILFPDIYQTEILDPSRCVLQRIDLVGAYARKSPRPSSARYCTGGDCGFHLSYSCHDFLQKIKTRQMAGS